MKNPENIIYFTNHQKILRFLLLHPEEKFYDRQISQLAGVSRAGSNCALRGLADAGMIIREQQGRMNYYHISLESSLIREMKIVLNMTILSELIDTIKPVCRKIVLFGSAAQGKNTSDSDFDILVITNDKQQANAAIMKSRLREKLHTVVVTQNEYIGMKVREPVFYQETQGGKVLWEKE